MAWYKVVKGGPRTSIKVAKNGFVVVDSERLCTNRSDTFAFPDQCDQVHVHAPYSILFLSVYVHEPNLRLSIS